MTTESTAAQRIAIAILHAHSGIPNARTAVIIDEMKAFALGGDLASMSVLYQLYTRYVQADRRTLLHRVPRIVREQYLCGNQNLQAPVMANWGRCGEEWHAQLQIAVANERCFALVVHEIVTQITATDTHD